MVSRSSFYHFIIFNDKCYEKTQTFHYGSLLCLNWFRADTIRKVNKYPHSQKLYAFFLFHKSMNLSGRKSNTFRVFLLMIFAFISSDPNHFRRYSFPDSGDCVSEHYVLWDALKFVYCAHLVFIFLLTNILM